MHKHLIELAHLLEDYAGPLIMLTDCCVEASANLPRL